MYIRIVVINLVGIDIMCYAAINCNNFLGVGMVRDPCPKCDGLSWYEKENKDIIQRCLCGYLAFVQTEKNGVYIKHVQPKTQVVLPRKGSKLLKCLGAIVSLSPSHVTTGDVSERSGFTTSKTASYLMLLEHKGLVLKILHRRGYVGGSTWEVTSRAVTLYNFKIKEV